MNKPRIFTLFGSTGDLAIKKIMPGLYKLFIEGRLPKDFMIVAFSRRQWTDHDYRSFIRPSLEKVDTATLDQFLEHVVYSQGHFQEKKAYEHLEKGIEKHDPQFLAQTFYYLAVQPEFYDHILKGLSQTGLLKKSTAKILVEKPFGHDEKSAKTLEAEFEKWIKPEQLLRVDHYLAKEGLQLLPKINPEDVQSIVVRVWETIGIEGRGEFYERIGALLDVGQNHAMEMLAAVLKDTHEHDECQARAQAIRQLKAVGDPVFGQYVGYDDEEDVRPLSHVETYFKINLESTDPKWNGVSIILEGGKAMPEKRSDITVTFKNDIQKVFDIQASPSGRDAYEILIEEAILGNKNYFASFEEILASWRVLQPMLKKRAKLEVKLYPKGTAGPTL
jgi:glucose-6-phosphate 1-dehydrogenase